MDWHPTPGAEGAPARARGDRPARQPRLERAGRARWQRPRGSPHRYRRQGGRAPEPPRRCGSCQSGALLPEPRGGRSRTACRAPSQPPARGRPRLAGRRSPRRRSAPPQSRRQSRQNGDPACRTRASEGWRGRGSAPAPCRHPRRRQGRKSTRRCAASDRCGGESDSRRRRRVRRSRRAPAPSGPDDRPRWRPGTARAVGGQRTTAQPAATGCWQPVRTPGRQAAR